MNSAAPRRSYALQLLTMPAPPSRNSGHAYRPDIDGLRALAILSVVLFHAKVPWFGGGFVGVDVFFVISGYLIGSLVYGDIRESKFSFLHFYERRAKRILPALIAVLLACNAIAFILLSPLELRDYCAQAFSAVASSSNIYYWLRSNYFNPSIALKPLLMTWSLGIEEQFYLLFPLSLFLAYKFFPRRVLQLVAAVCAGSFVICVWCANSYPSAAFYLLPTRAWELGLGVSLAILELERNLSGNRSAVASEILGSSGLALVLASVIAYSESTRFPGLAALLPTLGTACLISSPRSVVNRKLLASPPAVFVGLISYSWYLWHWPLLSFARIVSGGMLSVPQALLIATLSLGLAVLSHRFIEQPFRRSRASSLRLWTGYASVVSALAVAALAGYLHSGWPGRMPELKNYETAVSAVETNPCLAGFDETHPRLHAPCVISGSAKVALLGDSHAAALAPAIQESALHHGYGFELLAKASCPPLQGRSLRWTLRPTFEQKCSEFNHAALQHVLSDPSTTTVVLAGFWSAPLNKDSRQFYSDPSKPTESISEADSYSNFRSGLLRTIATLRASGKRVLVATDVPAFEPDPMSLVRNSLIRRRGQLASLLSSQKASLAPVAEESAISPVDVIADREVCEAATEGGAQLLDLSRNLCADSHCRFWDNGVLLYSDSSHLTAAGAEYALRGQDPFALSN